MQYKFYISYLELYNETGYDLLDPGHETKSLEDLPKVSMLEDEHGNFHLKNLSMHIAESEEDALELLFLGDTNRAIAETPMNMVIHSTSALQQYFTSVDWYPNLYCTSFFHALIRLLLDHIVYFRYLSKDE